MFVNCLCCFFLGMVKVWCHVLCMIPYVMWNLFGLIILFDL
jgi:hypothetical protein